MSRLLARWTLPDPMELRVQANNVWENLSLSPGQTLLSWRGDGGPLDVAEWLRVLLVTHSEISSVDVLVLSSGLITFDAGVDLQFDFDSANTNLLPMWLGWPTGTDLTDEDDPLTSPNVPLYLFHPQQGASRDQIESEADASVEKTTAGHLDVHRWRTFEEGPLEWDAVLAYLARKLAEASTLGSFERFILAVTGTTFLDFYYQAAPVFAGSYPSVSGTFVGPLTVSPDSPCWRRPLAESSVHRSGIERWDLKVTVRSVP